MLNRFDDRIIEDIESRIDLVDLVAESVVLSRKGNRYWGLCPFHQEKTPSFTVSREKQMFYCFGCHAGGNIFSFIMKRDGVEFKEALEMLARKAGLEIGEPQEKRKLDKRKQLMAVNRAAAEYYQQMLASSMGRAALDYFKKRGISVGTAASFMLGYAPNQWNSLEEYLFRKGFDPEWVIRSGLIKRREKRNSYYDVFRNRIIFPIFAFEKNIIGFGGRVLGDEGPKYLNSPENEIFSKRKNLYGLAQARINIRNHNEALLVEGYMDCIKLHQAGINNVVASLGTALTQEQATLLKRYAEKVVIVYDGDAAGQRETLRAIDVLDKQGLTVEVISLPSGKDPDEYLDEVGKEEFCHYIKNIRSSGIEFKLDSHINSFPVLNLEAKLKIIELLRTDIILLQSALERDYYIKLISQKLKIEENIVHREFKQTNNRRTLKAENRNRITVFRDNNKYGKYGVQEKILAAMLKNDNKFNLVKNRIGIDFFVNPDYQALANIYDQLQGENTAKMQAMNKKVNEAGLEASYAAISIIMEEEDDLSRELEEFILKMEWKTKENFWKNIFNEVNELKDEGNFDNILDFILELDRLINVTREGGIR